MARFVPSSKKPTLRRLRSPTSDEKVSSSTNKIQTPNANPVSPASSSTQNKKGSPDTPVSPVFAGDSGATGEPPRVSVDNRSTEKPLTQTTIEGEDGRKVVMSVYKVGEVERVEGDKVIRRTKLRFVLKYKDVVKECVSQSGDLNVDCGLAIKEVAKATHYSVPYKALREAISELRDKYAKEEAISIVDYVRQKYPDKLAEIEKDPFGWVLERTKEIVGYERLKLLTFLAIVSSQMERVMGMSRVHIMLVGPSGAGKSSTVKIVTRFVDGSNIYIPGTRLTQNALGYLDVETVDGKVLFIEQIDRQILNYLREMMTEEKITTWVTEKVVDEDGREKFVTRKVEIPGQAVVITTSVADNIDVDREQLFNRFLKVYVNPKSVDVDKSTEAIWTRKKSEPSEVDKLVFLAYLLSRPKFADNKGLLDRAKKFLIPIANLSREPINRTIEVLRNLTIAVSIARGKTKADDEDFDFVMRNFQLDILYNGLGLSERDVEFISALPDDGSLKTSEVADQLRVTKQYALNVLKNLERKGIVEGVKEEGDKAFTWYLTPLGKRIKALVSGLEDGVLEVKDQNGEVLVDAKFRSNGDGKGGRGNAVSVNDGGGVSGNEKEADRGAKEDEFSRRISKFYGELKGKIFSVREFYAVLGDELAEKVLKWAEERGLVNHKVIGDEEYIEFV
jgi:DNA-binding MarR family transcriptional regulator